MESEARITRDAMLKVRDGAVLINGVEDRQPVDSVGANFLAQIDGILYEVSIRKVIK